MNRRDVKPVDVRQEALSVEGSIGKFGTGSMIKLQKGLDREARETETGEFTVHSGLLTN